MQITVYASGGFAPKLTDSEMITLGVVGEFLGLDTDVGLWKYFRRHWPSQQAVNLWVVKQRLHQQLLIDLGRANMTDPRPPWVVRQLMCTRRLVETVIGQLTEPFHFEKIRARDGWHLTSRIARKVLAHTLGIFINRQLGRSDLQFEGVIA